MSFPCFQANNRLPDIISFLVFAYMCNGARFRVSSSE